MAPERVAKRLHGGQAARPSKKQKKQPSYTRDFVDKDGEDFPAVNLLDSDDDDIHNARADEGADSEADHSSHGSDSEDGATSRSKEKKRVVGQHDHQPSKRKSSPSRTRNIDNPSSDADPGVGSDSADSESASDVDIYAQDGAPKKPKKRNDPSAFATSLSKILATKLPASATDPVLARSAAARAHSRAALDASLESKARKQLRAQRREALEKGRVRDVLVATRNLTTGEAAESTADVLELERQLRKVAQRGVVKLFNAVRAAQVRAVEAEKDMRKDGVVGAQRREGKVTELSREGFLELIASGGGSLKNRPLEDS